MSKTVMSAMVVVTMVAVFSAISVPASAQTTGLTPGRFVVFGDIGFVADVGGNLNSSGIGRLNGVPAEMDANSWAERYDAAFLTRFGVAYNLNDHAQLLATTHWEQAEADPAVVGLIGQQPLHAAFSDYQGWGIDAGYRHYIATTSRLKPFGGIALGFERVQEITADLSGQPNFAADAVPFYSDSWVIVWRIGGGVATAFTDRLGLQISLDLQYTGVLNDVSGLGALGFERINNAGNKWTLPLTAGIYVKF